ncbi:aminotransferase [Polymorphobacter arshaanensis]|uniref:aspartate transaminase n=1 Tax=Glacieibacterium arshaanense TaxID=2511025 RepID=A0A4Y9ERJ2_9SPHN|nr:aminotransferase [Polymorphobacter arshaanensis]TFU06256.1 aminotransferase [Polymorphobacter arshaanensis]
MNPFYANMPTTIFEAMSARARATGAINLGQGFPDAQGPRDVLQAAADALFNESNQYPPMSGLPGLRAAVAAHYSAHQGLDLTPDEIIVTSGATEALAASILALVRPGDEVVLLQPMYDSYLPMVRQAGGIARLVNLQAPDWQVTDAMLAEVFNAKTALVVLNTPHNPTGSMLNAQSLAVIADYCRRFDCVALCDEVWEHVVFDGTAHLPLLALPGMRERCVKIGSAGKIFALTGWKVGWICACPALSQAIARAHQFLTFTTAPNLQHAVTYGLGKPADSFTAMHADLQRSRDRLRAALEAAGYAVAPSVGTYFMSIDLAASGLALGDVQFCDETLVDGVAAIPVSAFYAEAPSFNHVRLCFAKSDATLDAAAARLATTRARLA